MPTTIAFPYSANRSRRLDRSRRNPARLSVDLAVLSLWAIIMLLITAAVHFGAPSAEDSAIQLIGML